MWLDLVIAYNHRDMARKIRVASVVKLQKTVISILPALSSWLLLSHELAVIKWSWRAPGKKLRPPPTNGPARDGGPSRLTATEELNLANKHRVNLASRPSVEPSAETSLADI